MGGAFSQVGTLLNRMQLKTDVLPGGQLRVHVPPQRSDILHPVDVAEVSTQTRPTVASRKAFE